MPTIESFDPGEATGWARGWYSDTSPLVQVSAGIIQGGLDGFVDWWHYVQPRASVWVSEKFIARLTGDTVPNVEALRVEGAIANGIPNRQSIVWQERTKKSTVPDKLLKQHGFWQTGKMVGHTDGRDANDAILHMLHYMAFNLKHVPTLKAYFSDD